MRTRNIVSSLSTAWKKRTAQEEGLSLVELLVAMAVLLTILTASALVMTQGLLIQSTNTQYGQAVQLARIEIDKAKSLDYELVGYVDMLGEQTYDLPDGTSRTLNYDSNSQIDGESISESDVLLIPYKVEQYELSQDESGIPQEYTVITQVLNDDTYYSGGNEALCDGSKIVRVWVYWIEGDGELQETGLQYEKNPSIGTCAPQSLEDVVY